MKSNILTSSKWRCLELNVHVGVDMSETGEEAYSFEMLFFANTNITERGIKVFNVLSSWRSKQNRVARF